MRTYATVCLCVCVCHNTSVCVCVCGWFNFNCQPFGCHFYGADSRIGFAPLASDGCQIIGHNCQYLRLLCAANKTACGRALAMNKI